MGDFRSATSALMDSLNRLRQQLGSKPQSVGIMSGRCSHIFQESSFAALLHARRVDVSPRIENQLGT
jgi:hypothetical protein